MDAEVWALSKPISEIVINISGGPHDGSGGKLSLDHPIFLLEEWDNETCNRTATLEFDGHKYKILRMDHLTNEIWVQW